jgi:hypothetical protein
VTALLDSAGARSLSEGRRAQRLSAARRARRLVLEHPVAYYADAGPELTGQLRAPALAEDLTRLTGLTVERRAEGIALVDTSGRLSDMRFPGGGTVAQAALLLGARISEAAARTGRRAPELLPAPTAAERLADRAGRIDLALPAQGVFAQAAADREDTQEGDDGVSAASEVRYPFATTSWLRARTREIIAQYGAGFAADLRGDPDRLLGQSLDLLDAMSLIVRVEGGILVLPLLARYRGVTAEVKARPRTAQSPGASKAPRRQPPMPCSPQTT